MKQIIAQQKNQVLLQELKGKELVVYKSKDGEKYGLLSRLNIRGEADRFGFITLYDAGRPPSFISDSANGAIQLALEKDREVRMFDNTNEMLEAIKSKLF